jgi:hypothetical protein
MSILTGDNPFYRNREQLDEGVIAGDVRKKLNELQEYWNKNSEKFLSLPDPLFPIMGRPFTTAKKNGLLVVGINHPMPKEVKSHARLFIDAHKNKQLPVHDKDGWHIHWGTNGAKDQFVQMDRQKVNHEKNVLDKYLNSKKDVMDFRDPSQRYYKGFIRTMKALQREDLFKHAHFAELVPFASTGEKSIADGNEIAGNIYDKSWPWLESFILLCKPKIIFAVLKSAEIIADKFNGKQFNRSPTNKNNKRLMDTWELNGAAKGTILVAFQHFSGVQGVTHGTDYDRDDLRDILNDRWANSKPLRKDDIKPFLSKAEIDKIMADNRLKFDAGDLGEIRGELEDVKQSEGQAKVDEIINGYRI